MRKNCQRRKWYWNGARSATQVEGGERSLLALGRNICLVTPICLGTVTKDTFPNTLESKEEVFRTKELFFQELSKNWRKKKKVNETYVLIYKIKKKSLEAETEGFS